MLRATEPICKTDTGRQRTANEDSAYARAPMFAVADGMGGARYGEVASRLAIEAFQRELPDAGDPEQELAARVREANREIYERARAEPELHGMGTTMTAAYVSDGHIAIAHVGDSRAYLYRDGDLRRLTDDHTLVEELKRRGKLTEEQAAEHPQRSVITRALGVEGDVDVDTWTYPARAGDVLLLCSDGLTSMISEEQVASILGGARSLSAAATQLIAAANAAGGRDNITVVMFRLEDVGGEDGAEQTIVGRPARGAGETGERVPSSRDAAVALAPRPSRVTRLEPTPAAPRAPLPSTRRRRYAKPLAAVIAVVAVLFLVGGGGYLATRQLYFLGTDSQGIVTIYRGLPYGLPAGIHLYETYFVSGIPASLVPGDRRAELFNNDLRSQSSALSLVRDLELGQVSK